MILQPDKRDTMKILKLILKTPIFSFITILLPIIGVIAFAIAENTIFKNLPFKSTPLLIIYFIIFVPLMLFFTSNLFNKKIQELSVYAERLRCDISTQRTILAEGAANDYAYGGINWSPCGYLFLTELTLEHYPLKFSKQKTPSVIMLEDVTEVHSAGENYMFVKTKDGVKHEFFVWRAYTWEEKIKELIKANESSSY